MKSTGPCIPRVSERRAIRRIVMERFAATRPDHSRPENLGSAELGHAIASLRRKLRSVRASLRAAQIAKLSVLTMIMALGFVLLWLGPEPFLSRIFGNGEIVTIPELLAWWATVIVTALFLGIVGYRLFADRMRAVRAWTHKERDLARRVAHVEAEARRRGAA